MCMCVRERKRERFWVAECSIAKLHFLNTESYCVALGGLELTGQPRLSILLPHAPKELVLQVCASTSARNLFLEKKKQKQRFGTRKEGTRASKNSERVGRRYAVFVRERDR